jgi:hypothetical protein
MRQAGGFIPLLASALLPLNGAAAFEKVVLLHHWKLDSNLCDEVTGQTGELVGGATFSESNKAEGTASM